MQKVKLKGEWFMTLYGAPGEIKQQVSGHNVITEGGKSFIAAFFNSASTAASTFTMRYIGIGTDATAEAASNTALGTEVARISGTVSEEANAIFRVVATFPSGTGTGAITEYGLFSSSTNGTMLSRDTEAVINKGANDTLVVTTDVTIS